MPKIANRIGKITNGVEYVEYLYSDPKHAYYKFKCPCGNFFKTSHNNVLQGNTKSCGCIRPLHVYKTHGLSRSLIYNRWRGMLNRCNRSQHVSYKNYGGRGIKVCERWLIFENFYEDVGEPPFMKADLDRINNDGDYEPANIRWLTRTENCKNRRKRAK